MALNMSDSPPCTTPADVQAELHARLCFTQGWLEDQQAKAKARIECLNQLKTDPFLSSHVTNIDDLSRQQAVQQRLLVDLDSVHTQLRRTIEQAQCNTSENSEHRSSPQSAIPPINASTQAQARDVVKRKDAGRLKINPRKGSIHGSKDFAQAPEETVDEWSALLRGGFRVRKLSEFHRPDGKMSATSDAADPVATRPKKKHDPQRVNRRNSKKRKTSGP